MQDLGPLQVEQRRYAIGLILIREQARMCQLWVKKLVSVYSWAAPSLFVQLAHLDHNYP